MSVSPQGLSIQTLYRSYRNCDLLVNRQYQRKLVWYVSEKQELIDSIFKDYPLPLFLFAEKRKADGGVIWEVIDGIQRLNAIFGFIENSFKWTEKCFDIQEFARARQAAEENLFEPFPEIVERISSQMCANFLDYQLAVTVFPEEKAERITDVFRRINSGGRRLSDQERRQAGVLSPFAEAIRTLGAEIRGDVSRETLSLFEMPEISIDTSRNPHGYSLKAEDTFWCYQGILRTGDLRSSEDERVLAEICASIINDYPIDASGEELNKIYDKYRRDTEYLNINQKLNAYGADRLKKEVKAVVSAIKGSLENFSNDKYAFRNLIYPKATSNSQITPFYAVFMAFHHLMFKKELLPPSDGKYLESIKDLSNRLTHSTRSGKERKANIDVARGLLSPAFIKSDKIHLGHGPALNIDFENSIRRSKTESMRYEFKQGLYRLSASREFDTKLLQTILETICGIANVGPDGNGYMYIGIADKKQDVKKIEELDNVIPVYVPGAENIALVGIDREITFSNCSFENYQKKITEFIQKSQLTEPLKTSVLSSIDVITYKSLSILRITILAQKQISFIGENCFFRKTSSTQRATGPEIAVISSKFNQ